MLWLRKESARLLTLYKQVYKSMVSINFVKCLCFMSIHKYHESSQQKSAQKKDAFFPFKAFSIDYSYKYVSLSDATLAFSKQVDIKKHGKNKNLGLLLYPVSLSRPQKMSYLSRCRRRVRKENLSLLKSCPNPTWQAYQRSYIDQGGVSQEQDTPFSTQNLYGNANGGQKSPTNHTVKLYIPRLNKRAKLGGKSKSIWKGFTNTLMRHGNKLRYQTVLRKALLPPLMTKL